MMSSDTVAQQREQQETTLKRFVTYSLVGSFALHGVALCLKVNHLWKPNQAEPGEIAIVVTDPLAEELAEVIPSEESFSEPTTGSELAGSGGGAGETDAATIVEAPPASTSESETSVVKEPAEDEPEPKSTSVPVTEDEPEEDIAKEPVEEVAQGPIGEPTEEVAEATEPRNLSNLLEELQRAREQARPTAANRDDTDNQVGPSSSSGASDSTGSGLESNSTAAVGTSGLGSGSGRGSGAGAGIRTGTGTGTGDRPRRGSRSREISCRGCNFDYPENANGAEGTAQVIVETDGRGRVVSVTLARSSGNTELDRSALEQARGRVRLQGARAGESYPIEIDFVQPESEAARRVRGRGNRRSITVSDPEPAAETPEIKTPSTASNQSPESEPARAAEPVVTPEPSSNSTPEASPANVPDPEQPDGTNTPEKPVEPAPVPPPETTPVPISEE